MIISKTRPQIYSLNDHSADVCRNMYVLQELYSHKLQKLMDNSKWQIAGVNGTYHDIGKAYADKQREFLNIILKKGISVTVPSYVLSSSNLCGFDIPHGLISALLIPYEDLGILDPVDRKIVALSVAYHHERKWFEGKTEAEIKKQLKEVYAKILCYADEIEKETGLRTSKKLNPCVLHEIIKRQDAITDFSEEDFLKYVLLKGLLIRCDHAASAFLPVEDDAKPIGEHTKNFMASNGFSLNELQEFALANKDKSLIVTAQTGMGKTEAALLWMGEDKGFFTLPFRVSANAIYSRIKERMGYESVGLLHSGSREYLEKYPEVCSRSELLIPKVIISTVDQVLKFPFLYTGFEREFASLIPAKVVIDEIQSYDPKIVAMLIKALEMLYKAGGQFMIMTATLPPIYIQKIKERGIIPLSDIAIPGRPFIDGQRNGRHKIKLMHTAITSNVGQMIEEGKAKKVLVIVNTVKRAFEIYNKIHRQSEGKVNVFLLHKNFKKRHRVMLEKHIFKFSEDRGQNGIWITTQIVEASADIDFDVLHTEISPLDSLIQRLGRCFRRRLYKGNGCNVFIYIVDVSGVSPKYKIIYEWAIVQKSIELLSDNDEKVLMEEDKIRLVENLYSEEALHGTEFLKELEKALKFFDDISHKPFSFRKEEAQELLRDIDTVMVMDYATYENKIGLIEEYKKLMGQTPMNWKRIKEIRKEIEEELISVDKSSVKGKIIQGCGITDWFEVLKKEFVYDFDETCLSGKGLVFSV